MNQIVDALNRWANEWSTLVVDALWQSTLVALLIAIAAYALRRSSPAVRYWLWQIVAIKLLVLPVWSWSIGLPWLPADSNHYSQSMTATALLEKSAASDPAGLSGSIHLPPVRSAAPPTTRLATLSPRAWIFLGWATVVCLLVIRLCVQRVRLARLLQHGGADDDALAAAVHCLAIKLGLGGPPRVLLLDADCSPFVCGIARPALVLPSALLPTLNAAELQLILAHELTHLARRDLVWGWIPEVARVLFFFHPIIHWASYRIRLERELACDQAAMTILGRGPVEYADTLLKIVGSASMPGVFRTASAAPFSGGAQPRSQVKR